MQGIGKGIVEEIGGLGGTVFTCARTQEDLDKAIKEWRAEGLEAYGIVADCSKSEVCAWIDPACIAPRQRQFAVWF